MSQDQFNQTDLTEDQYLQIVDVLKKHGDDIPENEFPEYILQWLEDIPGLELISDSEANEIINKLWSLYHDQNQ